MSVRMALAKLCACTCGGAIIGGGAVHVCENPPERPAVVERTRASGPPGMAGARSRAGGAPHGRAAPPAGDRRRRRDHAHRLRKCRRSRSLCRPRRFRRWCLFVQRPRRRAGGGAAAAAASAASAAASSRGGFFGASARRAAATDNNVIVSVDAAPQRRSTSTSGSSTSTGGSSTSTGGSSTSTGGSSTSSSTGGSSTSTSSAAVLDLVVERRRVVLLVDLVSSSGNVSTSSSTSSSSFGGSSTSTLQQLELEQLVSSSGGSTSSSTGGVPGPGAADDPAVRRGRGRPGGAPPARPSAAGDGGRPESAKAESSALARSGSDLSTRLLPGDPVSRLLEDLLDLRHRHVGQVLRHLAGEALLDLLVIMLAQLAQRLGRRDDDQRLELVARARAPSASPRPRRRSGPPRAGGSPSRIALHRCRRRAEPPARRIATLRAEKARPGSSVPCSLVRGILLLPLRSTSSLGNSGSPSLRKNSILRPSATSTKPLWGICI